MPRAVPIVAFAGGDDDEARSEQLDSWRRHTSADFELHVLPGGQFFINAERGAVMRVISKKPEGLS